MKPAPFEYRRPASREETIALLAQEGYGAKLLAGGQSLIPTMNFRLAQPSVLIDLHGVPDLAFVESTAEGVRIGAMTTQTAVERSDAVRDRAPLLREAMPFVAHSQIRNRGTVGGSLAHADPAAELPAVMLALGAVIEVQGPGGTREVAAEEFFTGLFATALGTDEVLTAVRIPAPPERAGFAFEEVARRHGDFALVGVAVAVQVDEQDGCREARIALLSVGDGPVLAERAGELLRGAPVGDARAGRDPGGRRPTASDAINAAAATAAREEIDPFGDIHASAPYRRHLAEVLVRRALVRAFARVVGEGVGDVGSHPGGEEVG